MKKVLIWDISFPLANVGGPSGYLYNIHEYLKQHPQPQITFLSDLMPQRAEGASAPCRTIKSSLRQWLAGTRLNDFLFTVWKEYHVCNVALPAGVDLNEYDYVHFHQANDVSRYAPLLKGKRCKTIVTTHCPCPRTEEVLSSKPRWYRLFASVIRRQERAGYAMADYLMFPCCGAREPYEKDARLKSLFASMEDKFFYCPSSILDATVHTETMQTFADLGIPEGSFVITYFGRHNEIKGYDILKRIGTEILDKYPHVYIVCAGKGPLTPPEHPRWMELGFIHNTQELLLQSNLYVLPNRETYFDLVVLEVLRSATPLLLSDNGGNTYFKTLPAEEREGLVFLDPGDVAGAVRSVSEIVEMRQSRPEEYRRMGEANRRLFESRFELDSYIRRYTHSLEQLEP